MPAVPACGDVFFSSVLSRLLVLCRFRVPLLSYESLAWRNLRAYLIGYPKDLCWFLGMGIIMEEIHKMGTTEHSGVITTDWLRTMYGTVVLEEVSDAGGLRKCECDVMRLLELETDWDGVRAAITTQGMCEREAVKYLRLMADANIDRAKRAVSSFSDESYEAAKIRYREMRDLQFVEE